MQSEFAERDSLHLAIGRMILNPILVAAEAIARMKHRGMLVGGVGKFVQAAAGKFDAILQAWNNDPSPSSGVAQVWSHAGFGGSNFLRYDNPAFDALVERATGAATTRQARPLWRAAIETINADAPAIFLFAPDNVAVFHSRVVDVQIRPDSWAALLRTWRIPSDRLIDRDRVER